MHPPQLEHGWLQREIRLPGSHSFQDRPWRAQVFSWMVLRPVWLPSSVVARLAVHPVEAVLLAQEAAGLEPAGAVVAAQPDSGRSTEKAAISRCSRFPTSQGTYRTKATTVRSIALWRSVVRSCRNIRSLSEQRHLHVSLNPLHFRLGTGLPFHYPRFEL